MKEKTKKRIHGSISILLIIVMLPMMTMAAVIVDSSRINMARSMVSSAGDLSMNTALANYDTILKDVYGLFAMSQNMTDEELADSLKEYFATTLVSYGVVSESESGDYVDAVIGDFRELIANSKDGKASNFLDMNIVDFTATKVENSSLANTDILRSQIVEYMKYRAPLNFGLSFLDSLKAFKNVQAQTDVVQKQVKAQESVQDVTSACQTAIKSIRSFDSLIESILTGDKAVKGKDKKSDNEIVALSEYHTQVDKYLDTWEYNYSHANKLNLVFLLKAPSVSSLYLKNLNTTVSEWFIKTDSTGLTYNNSGISVTVSLEDETDKAKTQVINQINHLSDDACAEYKTSESYKTADFLSTDYIATDYKSFNDEGKAIDTFIAFEKFLLNEGTVKYSDVKTALESIYTLGKYYDNYYTKISAEIETAKKEMDEAVSKKDTAENNANTYYANISTAVTNINNADKNYADSYDFLNGILNSEKEDLKTAVSNLLAHSEISMPTSVKTSGGKSFTDFANFINNNYKESVSDSDNTYLKLFKEIISSSLKSSKLYSKICTTASTYLYDLDSGKTEKTFKEYIVNSLGEEIVSNSLYKLLEMLYTNSEYVKTIDDNISLYDGIYNSYEELVADVEEKTQVYNDKVSERDNVKSAYIKCLQKYNTFAKKYQNDLYYYEKYISAAKSIISDEVAVINNQFTAIKSNVKSIIDQLGVIETNLTNVYSAVTAYNDNLAEWESVNNTYVSNNSSDSFSKQNSADIEASKSQYNPDSLKTLQEYVTSIKKEYQDFYNRITDSTHFKYGSKKIDTITTAENMKAAVPSNVADSLSAVVTVEDADSKLSELYNSESTGSIEVDNWYFLNPVLPIQFLKYLNENYPEATSAESQSVKVAGEALTVGDGENDFNYESTKNSLIESSGGDISDDTDTDKYGYSYKGKTVSTTDLPSEYSSRKEDVANDKFDVSTKNDGDVDVSSGFDSQSTALESILSGINEIATNTLENTYILSYIFNNFSYNTLIQDLVMEENNANDDTALSSITKANKYLDPGSESLNQFKDKHRTLSNYSMNKNNNYLYGAEIEYILYGNTDASKNVNYTKASIYAIRFAFNCIYAFTNAEIRNSTMSVGLAVQAATFGIVPYQIVQIVLQLALAAAESAIDLKMMSSGLKVAIVKTSDTWSLSISSAVKSAGELIADESAELATNAINTVSSGLQGLVDSGTEQLNSSISYLSDNLNLATKGKLQEVVDGAFTHIQSKIEDVLNELQFVDFDADGVNATAVIEEAFDDLENSLAVELQNKFGGNEIADMILPKIIEQINGTDGIVGMLPSIKNDLLNQIKGLNANEIGNVIVSNMTIFKLNLIDYASEAIDNVSTYFEGITISVTSDISEKLNGYIEQTSEEISEEVSNTIKEEVTNATNSFISEYLDDNVSNAVGSGVEGSVSSSVASMLKFGYKEYLMFFMFISISVNDDAVLARTADIIQLNIQNAKTANGASYQHSLTGQSGKSFKMSEAKTYIAVNASVNLEMLFMNMDFFTNILSDKDDTDVSGQLTSDAVIEYNGLYGY